MIAVVVGVLVAPAAPIGAATVTQTNACRWLTGELVPMELTVSGSGTPTNPAYLGTLTLSSVTVSGAMPWWAAQVAYDLGLIKAGPNTIPLAVRLTIGATGASPAAQDVVAWVTASVTFDPNQPFTPAAQAGHIIKVTNLVMPSSTWTRTGQAAPTFRQRALTVRLNPGTPTSVQVLRDCFPATWTTDDVPVATPVTPSPFAVVGSSLPDPRFSDVKYGHPFFREVEWAAAEDVATGYADGTFRPTNVVNRQAFASFLYKAAGAPPVSVPSGPTAFPDVPRTHAFFHAIEWARQHQIIAGYVDGTFKPTAPVTRQAAAQWIMRATGRSAATPSVAPFRDVSLNHPFVSAIAWLEVQGIATGHSDGTFRPGATVARQAAAAWLQRAHS